MHELVNLGRWSLVPGLTCKGFHGQIEVYLLTRDHLDCAHRQKQLVAVRKPAPHVQQVHPLLGDHRVHHAHKLANVRVAAGIDVVCIHFIARPD